MKKTLITILVTVLVCGSVFGTTLALLMDSTDPITNTFTVGDINITLTESKTADADGLRTFKMVPGTNIVKDPKVTVLKDSEACYLFVKVVESENFGDFMTYGMAEGWKIVPGETNVYCREVDATTADTEFNVLAGNIVTVGQNVTKDDLAAAKTSAPTLTFTAYAVQSEGVADATAAWANFKS